ncbi:uncharacterized protein BXZ73DRAFT_41651 [Epithele typhae]|uniref:uncharacterized protein n=1 Tax=Epithele typhae TaxID=378194 RepID=UPI002007ADD2|nr:uncharacterized protein BXZ73DRAFT_41651 [Epithele typhae]KAH9941818.1 hypothetical protein BXZ73DRAFT_41651 [Epithele typhae]
MVVDEPLSDKMITELPLSEALRLVVRLRHRHDLFTQDARINPILYSNRQLASLEEAAPPPPEKPVVEAVVEKGQKQAIEGHYERPKHSLRKRFAQHQVQLAEKVARLKKEYLALHEKWLVHCSKMDEVARAGALEEAASAACRTTRRTTAMGDAVRSDLEMEQILASLGNEELTDANHLSAKNAAVIPDMVSVTKGNAEYIYDDTNHLVEDPHEFYKLETGMDDWTEEEKVKLIEVYAKHPKQFGIIAEHLPNKTPAQCVSFYYLHKNWAIDFRKAVTQYNYAGRRRRSGRKQKGNALLADILKHDDEVQKEGATSSSGRRKRGAATPVPNGDVADVKKASASVSKRGTAQNTPAATPTPDPEPVQKRPRRRANLSARAAAASQEQGEEDADEDVRPAKRTRKGGRKSKADADVVESMLAVEDVSPTPADGKAGKKEDADTPDKPAETTTRKKQPGSNSTWSDEDQALFLKLLAQHGDDFKRIAAAMPNKTTIQVSAFYRSNLTEMQLAKVAAQAPKRSPSPATAAKEKRAAERAAAAAARTSGRMSPPPAPVVDATQGFETVQRRHPPELRTPLAVPYHTPYGSTASMNMGLGMGMGMGMGMGVGLGLGVGMGGMGAMGGARPPPTLGMSFPAAMAYSNLAPSSFVTGSSTARRPPTTTPGEMSEFAPQTWGVMPTRPSPPMPTATVASTSAPSTPAPPAPGTIPATLQTAEDLARYLELRTRLAAAQPKDSDFM